MGLRDIESSLPPGFRFYPSDEELVGHYLYKKVANERVTGGTLVEVDLHTHEPWELPEVAKLSSNEWYFFSFRDRKYATGSRTNRATRSGYWKATGKDRTIYDPTTKKSIIGMRKTLVFYRGRAPNGAKTGWVMHEFRLETPYTSPKEDWVLCRVIHKRKAESEQESIAGSHSPTLMGTSPPHHMDHLPMPDGLYDQMGSSFPVNIPFQDDSHGSNTFLNLQALMNSNFLGFPHEVVPTTPILGMGSMGGGDELGYMLDVGLEEDQVTGEGELSFPRWQG